MAQAPSPAVIVVCVFILICGLVWIVYETKNSDLSEVELVVNKVELLAVSPFEAVKPLYLAIGRSVIALWSFTILLAALIIKKPNILSYYTTWNYILLCFYFCCTSVLSWIHVYNPERSDDRTDFCTRFVTENMPEKFGYYGRYVLWFIFQGSLSTVWVVNITSWVFLGPFEFEPFNLSWHFFNMFQWYIELGLNPLPIRFRFAGPVLLSFNMVYILFTWIYHWGGGNWPYEFVDYTKHTTAVTIIVLGIVHLGLLYCVVLLSEKSGRDENNDQFVESLKNGDASGYGTNDENKDQQTSDAADTTTNTEQAAHTAIEMGS